MINLDDIIVCDSTRRTRPFRSVKGIGLHSMQRGATELVEARSLRLHQDPEQETIVLIEQFSTNPHGSVSHAYVLPSGKTVLALEFDQEGLHGGYGGNERLYRQGYKHWRWYRGRVHDDLRRLSNGERYAGWKSLADQEGFDSPLELTERPNQDLWSITLVPRSDQQPYTAAQLKRVAELVDWASSTFGFRVSFRTVLEHRHWNPLKAWPWSPGGNWSRRGLGDELRRLTGDEKLCIGGSDC